MDKAADFTATVTRLERMRNSVNGNPKYRVGFDNGRSHVTMADAGFCYGITNPEMRGQVDVWLTKAGTIRAMSPAAR
jgi:hypothetical protein